MKTLNKHIFAILSFSFLSVALIGCSKDKSSEEKEEIVDQNDRKVTMAEVEDAIKKHINEKTEENNGFFKLPVDSSDLNLKLVRVHTEYLSQLGPNRYFACVDLADTNGDVYDIDFFMEGKVNDATVTETSIHKLNGKPFYSWKQQDDKSWKRVPMEKADNQLLGVVEGMDRFNFSYKTNLPEIKEKARIWLPIAQSDLFQRIKITSINLPDSAFKITKEEVYENEIFFAELGPAYSNKTVEIQYEVERKEKAAYSEKTADHSRYLQATPLLPLGGRFQEIVGEATAGMEDANDLVRARALYDYIIDNMRYAKNEKYGTGDAVYACDSKTGNCTEFHSLFISLARTANIPARFAIGAAIPSERNEGGINGYHCWAEFYAEGKWWPIDISEGNKYTALATYYFGHHPANRIELSKGRNFDLNPESNSGKINFFAYPKFEIDGQEMVSNAAFSFERIL